MAEKSALEIVAASPWFEELPEDALKKLAAAAQFKTMAINSLIYEQGMPTTEVYCIISGRVRVSISSPNGQEFALVDHEADTWLGAPGLVGDDARVIDARVIEPSSVLVIPREDVLKVVELYPVVYRSLFLQAQETLRDFHLLMSGILFYSLRARVAGRLLEFARVHGVQTGEGVLLDIKVSQNEFGRLALGSRQRVNKVFRDWSDRGVVMTRDERLLIPDLDLLEQEINLFE